MQMYVLQCTCLLLGVMVIVDGQQQLVKAQLLCAVMDLPAKAALLNVMQYNGEYGCITCKHSGCMVCKA